MASRIEWRRSGVPLLLLGSTALFVLGITLPTLRIREGFGSDAHSVLGGIRELFAAGDWFLGGVILAFSVVFPSLKLLALFVIWTQEVEGEAGKISWLGVLGKWSMLDVYVAMLFVGSVHLGILAEFEVEPGIYVFAAAILSTIVVRLVIERLKGYRLRIRVPPRGVLRAGGWRWLSLVSIATFAAGCALPLMRVEKWLFWSSETSLLGALGRLYAEEAAPLAVLVTAFVLLLPAAHLAGLAWARWGRRRSDRGLRALLAVEEWAMLDVFAVALLVVAAQIASLASIEPRQGLYCLILAAVSSAVDARQLRTALRARTA